MNNISLYNEYIIEIHVLTINLLIIIIFINYLLLINYKNLRNILKIRKASE